MLQTLLSVAFRPFFLIGSFCAFGVIFFWTIGLLGIGPMSGFPNLYLWHAHEMVFGFVLAVVAGFSLTAVATWTGRPPIKDAKLVWLIFAWSVGRIAMVYSPHWPAMLVAVADLLFPCLLAIFFGREVIAANNQRNLPLVVVVALFAALNLLFHLGNAINPALRRTALLLAVHLILLLVAVIAGRIIPSFTTNWMRATGKTTQKLPRSLAAVDNTALILTAITGLAITFAPAHPASAAIAWIAAVAHAIRLSHWSGLHTRREPLLLILHLAYLWFPLGYALTGLAVFSGYSSSVALHALTIGVIAGMIIAMMSRVALGHTGRPLHAARLTVFAYTLWMLTTVIRLSGPLWPAYYIYTVETAASMWMVTFALFAWVYWPILCGPRVDQS